MVRKTILIFFIFCSTCCFSQQLLLRLEGGLNSAGFPKSYGNKWDGKLKPVVRPAIGFHLIGEAKFGLFADVNARYFVTGLTDTYSRNDIDRINNTWYRAKEEQKYIFTRLAYGVGLGYKLPILKKKISVIGGYRKIYHISGTYSYKNSYEDGLGNLFLIEKTHDPFDDPDLLNPAPRNGKEIYFAVGFDFTTRLGCLIQYSFPSNVIFHDNVNSHYSIHHHAYVRNDASIAILYGLR